MFQIARPKPIKCYIEKIKINEVQHVHVSEVSQFKMIINFMWKCKGQDNIIEKRQIQNLLYKLERLIVS
jgi:hypothetical protein